MHNVIKKALRGTETETRKLLGGTKENRVSLTRGHRFALPCRQTNDFCYKKETEDRIEVVTRPEDNQKRKTEALALYQEGVEMLIQATKTIKDNPNTVLAYKKKAQECITRAEQLKMQINQDKKEGKFHEQVL